MIEPKLCCERMEFFLRKHGCYEVNSSEMYPNVLKGDFIVRTQPAGFIGMKFCPYCGKKLEAR